MKKMKMHHMLMLVAVVGGGYLVYRYYKSQKVALPSAQKVALPSAQKVALPSASGAKSQFTGAELPRTY